ncbi:pyridoxamine 5'-phosphate oxidase family protein [Aliiglaciecola sp. LCG003]|uniref:pyridoxamine 5'-phosphate oxidase family protein n=1 Tax=Aliiglaciecola sp. LCG003 TaxID=3053655 RepID=UPI002572807B|nr:pyridoxamine 5'-phosphate oxidase family protein [Aliiglaciecola sp. LCG003]WJG09897.1 pyridoxamine 5'-phosphate oxidase family protein [Aliiglaciecola sp. LCG003]
MPTLERPIWRSHLHHSLDSNEHLRESTYLQFTTVSCQGLPEVRTVVFRGFVPNSHGLMVHTDVRSGKISQLRRNSNAALCWYFAKTREQYRLSAKVVVVDAQYAQSHPFSALRDKQWLTLSPSAQQSYWWPKPRTTIGLNDEYQTHGSIPATQNLEQVSPHFCLLVIEPSQIDYLHLATTPHLRIVHRVSQQGWHSQNVNP